MSEIIQNLQAVFDKLRENNAPTDALKLYMSAHQIQIGIESNQIDPETMRTINQPIGLNGVDCILTLARTL